MGTKDCPVVSLPTLGATATPEALTCFHTYVQEFWEKLPRDYAEVIDEKWQMLFTTALAEIISNIITHAYENPNCLGQITFQLLLYTDRVVGEFTDQGIWPGQISPSLPSAGDISQLAESGRGLYIVQATTDELNFWRSNDGENHWLVVKRFAF